MRLGRVSRHIALLFLGTLLGMSGAGSADEDFFKALQIQRFTPPRPPQDFALPTLDGRTVRLSDFRGKVVFLNFWATWCPACREEMPSMEQLHREFKGKGLVLLAVNLQEPQKTVTAFMEEFGLTFPALLDGNSTVSDRYRVSFIPTTYLVDKQGILLGRVVGPKDWASPRARRLIASLLDPALLAALGRAEAPGKLPGLNKAIRDFLEHHWKVPIPPQGKAPARFTPVEASLSPQNCGVCHPAQRADWQTSLHAKAMGPGVMGQLVDMIRSDPESALDCQRCHSPLSEQQESRSLRAQGLVCATCHVRGWKWFGPPKRDGSLESSAPPDQLPHNGATRTGAFLRSEFCQSCHQFPEDGFALNGKLLENTYAEWKASPYARQGIQCQNCHMPDRRHLWRGIHDPEMVKQGVTVDVKTAGEGSEVRATLTITNTGVGHYFPTYVTPKVFLRMDLVDAQGEQVEGSFREAVIGREVALDLSRELYDTRLAPKASFTMKRSWKVERSGLRLRARVIVEPDHFYTKFFQATIPQAGLGRTQLEEALRLTRRSPFRIFERQIAL